MLSFHVRKFGTTSRAKSWSCSSWFGPIGATAIESTPAEAIARSDARTCSGGELVEEVLGEPGRDDGGIAERPDLRHLGVPPERGELGGDALLEQDPSDPVSRVATIAIDTALDERGDTMCVVSSGGGATFVDLVAGPADVGGCSGLGEDRSVRAAARGAEPERPAHPEHDRRHHCRGLLELGVLQVDVVPGRGDALAGEQTSNGTRGLLERAHGLLWESADLLHPGGDAVPEAGDEATGMEVGQAIQVRCSTLLASAGADRKPGSRREKVKPGSDARTAQAPP